MASIHFTEGQSSAPESIYHADQLMPNIVDGMALTRPNALYAQIPNSFTSYEDGYRKVTYRHLANAINRVAWLLSKQLGTNEEGQTLAYIGPNDIGYVVVILGAAKAGYSILSPSPRLVEDDYAKLFEATRCTTLLTLPPPYSPAVKKFLDATSGKTAVVHVPTIYELLDEPSPHFPFPYTYEAIKDRPLVTVHTSGTTGTPKPLTWTHATASAFIRELRAPPPDGYYNSISLIQSNRMFAMFPLFHSGGIMIAAIEAIASQTVIITALGGVPPSAQVIIDGMKLVDIDVLCSPSPFVEQIAKNKEWSDFVASRTKSVVFSGADLSEDAGNAFTSAGVLLTNLLGSSEAMTTPTLRALHDEPADAWHYLHTHSYVNAVFEPQADDLFELVWVRNPEPHRVQPVFTVFPHLKEFHTRDLFTRHPDRPEMWRFKGRSDDMIAAATGEVCNPVVFEQQISHLPEVKAALMVGTGRWQKALLVEPAAEDLSPSQHQGFIDRIWPSIDLANQKQSLTSRIAKSHIVLTSPDQPMLRSSKGTVQRAPTLKLYAKQLDDLYARNGDDGTFHREPIPVHLTMPMGRGDTIST